MLIEGDNWENVNAAADMARGVCDGICPLRRTAHNSRFLLCCRRVFGINLHA